VNNNLVNNNVTVKEGCRGTLGANRFIDNFTSK
jgi:hypothetical protein